MDWILSAVIAQSGSNWYLGTSLLAKLVFLFGLAIVLGIIKTIFDAIFKRR
jgi:hypothetical protein